MARLQDGTPVLKGLLRGRGGKRTHTTKNNGNGGAGEEYISPWTHASLARYTLPVVEEISVENSSEGGCTYYLIPLG